MCLGDYIGIGWPKLTAESITFASVLNRVGTYSNSRRLGRKPDNMKRLTDMVMELGAAGVMVLNAWSWHRNKTR